ncbi:MAG: winged helix DNA-binding protein [Deltaproteobacteria bacterium]|nr:winged helix DNA-binding protein [Deltaproteobacteria bacterium]
MKTPALTPKKRATPTVAAELQEFFYPIHYQIGMALEDALRGGLLTRKQSAILWMIRSAGEERRQMRRKDIVQSMQSWFEVTNSGLSKAIRGMAREPLALVEIAEDPRSAREKLVTLTPKGEEFIAAMAARGEVFLHDVVQHLPANVTRGGIEYLQQLTAAFNQSRAMKGKSNGKRS